MFNNLSYKFYISRDWFPTRTVLLLITPPLRSLRESHFDIWADLLGGGGGGGGGAGGGGGGGVNPPPPGFGQPPPPPRRCQPPPPPEYVLTHPEKVSPHL